MLKNKFIFILFFIGFSLSSCKSTHDSNYKSFKLNDIFSTKVNNIKDEKTFKLSNDSPKYKDFTLANARYNIKKAILSHPTFQKNIYSYQILKSNNKIAEASKAQVNFQAVGGLARQDEENTLGASGSINVVKLLYDYGAVDQGFKSSRS